MNQEPEVILGESGPSMAGWHKVEDGLRCMKEYQYRQIRGIRKPLRQTPDAFSVGSGVHAMRARWFSLRFASDAKAWASIMEAMRISFEEQKLPVSLKAEQSCRKFFEEYVRHWSVRPKPTPLAAEYEIGPAPMAPDDPFWFYRTARLDDVSKYLEAGGALCIGESKTTSSSIKDCINQYTLHGQPILQYVLWKTAPQGEKKHGPVAGVMLDVIKKGYGDEASAFARQFIPITQRTVDWYVKNMRAYLRAMQQIEWNTDAPRNINSCTRLVGRARIPCEFRELCVHGRSASVGYVLRDGSSLRNWKPTAGNTVPPWD